MEYVLDGSFALARVLPDETSPVAIRRLSALALTTGLSAYDAAYLDLAVQKGIGLATGDRQLREKARHAGVAVV